jgi:hypothetical protein
MENKINEAEVSEVKNSEDKIEDSIETSNVSTKEDSVITAIRKKWLKDFYIELILFFVLGVLLGIAIKTEAAKRITIGFDDYKMKIRVQDYDINKIQIDLALKEQKELEEAKNAEQEQGQDSQNENENENEGIE